MQFTTRDNIQIERRTPLNDFKENDEHTLLNDFKETDEHIITDHKNDWDQILLYRNKRHKYDTNRMILLSAVKFCIDGKRSDLPLV